MKGLKIGTVARRSDVNPQTIHYYERRELLPEPRRSASNYRLYTEDAIKRIRFIKHAQELGFTLNEIKELLSLRAEPGAECADVRDKASEKIVDVNEKIRTLTAMKRVLTELVDQCDGEGSTTECPIIEALDSEDHQPVEAKA